MDNQQLDPPATYAGVTDTAACLNPSWFLMDVEAGFESWFGGNGLQSDSFQAHVLTSSTAVQSGIFNGSQQPVVNWQNPFEVIYSGCTSNTQPGNTVSFQIDGFDNPNAGNTQTNPMDWPSSTTTQQMTPVPGSSYLFEYTVNAPGTTPLQPMHGSATIVFTPSCSTTTSSKITIYIDPSGHVYYSDGKTPVVGANVTLEYSPSASGPFQAVPNHNYGLTSAIMDPDDNTLNSMPSTQYGAYGWDVAPGYSYQVTATKNGCGTVTSPVQSITDNTPPITNLNLELPCAPPPPLPPPTTGPPAGSGNCHVTYNVTNAVPGVTNGLTVDINIQNTGKTAIYPWTLGWTFPGNQKITYAWNVNESQSGENVSMSSIASWESIPAGGTLTGAVGFNGTFTGTNAIPTTFTLNGLPCD
jgi:hypothetical protein